MSAAAAVVGVLIAVWLALTVLAQFRLLQRLLSPFDGFHLIPRWTFFAPNPGVRDYHLVVRERLADGRLTSWQNVPVYEARPPLAFLWHPQKRASKVLSDAIQTLGFLLRREGVSVSGLPFTLPYLVLLRYAARAVPAQRGATEFQFAIVDSAGHFQRPLECPFLSSFHRR